MTSIQKPPAAHTPLADDEVMSCPTCGEEFEADYWDIGDRLKRAALADAAPALLAALEAYVAYDIDDLNGDDLHTRAVAAIARARGDDR